ncbi:V-type ATP synthase subunit I [Alkalitalea saponilacus]|uniref:V/A-type H+-transporting ATPase subunit I n=1 Tax=Alkalitalea saponilacus TaxID=889453 RepID=A0A1T5B9S1_9BACT|nr:V-type ATPase 116kDa subunit family protein [Alkalitalea saponilacus]ASB49747.1 V-type ATP synthase subunit I [Alkalitalea saponilacus]SKB43710.1 V/A-type H+-transporting ATPase subunit I [Alkalitalea saponilacus]
MIVPMLKYSFLVYHAEYKSFLKDLKHLGVLHIETKRKEPTSKMQELFRSHTDLTRTIGQMRDRVKDKNVEGDKPALKSGDEVLNRIREVEGKLEQLNQQVGHLEKEAQQLMPWGDFSIDRVQELENSGVYFRFLVCRTKQYKPAWEDDFFIQVISDQGDYRYFLMIDKSEDRTENPIELPGAEELQLPDKSLGAIRKEQEEIKKEIAIFNSELDLIAAHCMDALEAHSVVVKGELDESNAWHQTEKEVEDQVMLIEGWVPKPKVDELNSYLDKNNILYVAKNSRDDEKVPVLLKNNRFARLFEPIGNMYELPNSKELDLVPFFAPFYMLFFGFALGDAGYGLLIIAIAFWLKYAKVKDVKFRRILTLAQWLGLSTVVFGVFTGTFLGINLMEAEVAWLERFKEYMIDPSYMFYLALSLGVIQILFAMVLKIINISIARSFRYAYSTVGWLILLIGSGVTYVLKITGAFDETVASYSQNGVLIGSGALILLFSNPKRNILMNFLAGLWDVYGMLTGLVGDVLSYIRLFALGISSAILGFVFNQLAFSLKPDNIILGPLVMVLVLVIGHSMTIFMAGLGAFVHPIRLTFVEFYKNAGFTGGGKAYAPFAEKSVE